MKFSINHLKKVTNNHRTKKPSQTGFSSPATHYTEPPINLHEALVKNHSATFFVRVIGHEFNELHIFKDDVLIVDRSLTPTTNQLVLAIKDGEFIVMRMPKAANQLEVWGVITYIIHVCL